MSSSEERLLETSPDFVWLQEMSAAMDKQPCDELFQLLNRQSIVRLVIAAGVQLLTRAPC